MLYSILGVTGFLMIALIRIKSVDYRIWYFVTFVVLGSWLWYFVSLLIVNDPAGHTLNAGGLLWVTPFISICIADLRRERRTFWTFIWLISITYIFTVTVFSPVVNGVHWGPRLIVLIIPFLLITGAKRAQRWWVRYGYLRPLLILLISISVINQFYSYYIIHSTKSRNKEVVNWVEEKSEFASVSNAWWLGGDLAVLADELEWYHVKNSRGLKKVLAGLGSNNQDKFYFYEFEPYLQWDQVDNENIKQINEEYFYPDRDKSVNSLKRVLIEFIPDP